ncbi:MAG: efflux RND transporter permease subunit [Thermoanaerobaculia bacterium]|nr:efflux RND transporter permease subunit [Thermoanaerobaculia bacterium]
MSWLDALLARRRLIIATTALLATTGIASWFTMPREEDPHFPHRDGTLITIFPGADAETVERLVVEPLEEHLAEVAQVRDVHSTARAGVSVMHVEMHETVYDTETAWDEVEDAIEKARKDFPAGVLAPDLEDDLVSQDAIVYALTGDADPLKLVQAAELLKRYLLSVEGVKQVDLHADPGEQITIEYDDAVARRLGIDPALLGHQLSARSRIVPGGILHLGEKTAPLRPATEFRSLEEIRSTPVMLPSGSSIPLSEIARVRRGPAEPASERMRWNGESAIAVAVVPQDGLDRVTWGERVRATTESARDEVLQIGPIDVEEMFFQPDLVKERLDQLTGSLKLGILIVASVLLFAMGPRLGLVVSLVVPLVALGSVALFAAGGGILHQISIASLVIALGMLVDNAIVVAENIQFHVDDGLPVHNAAVKSVKELALPLGTATGTTLAAFVPMLASKGNTADFTRAIPVLIMLTLFVSYFFAVLVTPVMSELLLRPATRDQKTSRIARLARRVSKIAVHRSGWVLVGAVALLAATAFSARWVDRKFFPAADRMTAVIELEMPEGTHLDATDEQAARLEQQLLRHPAVETVSTFLGRNGPKLYYNMMSSSQSPHRATLIVETRSFPAVDEILQFSREFVHDELPDVTVVARKLEQGPPISAPVEVRVLGHDFADLERVADQLLRELRSIEGTADVRHDLGLGAPQVAFEIDDAAAARFGITRVDVAQTLSGRTLGAEVGQYRVGEDPVPILIRSAEGERLPASRLTTLDIAGRTDQGSVTVPLAQVATPQVQWRPAAIQHQHRTRVVTVQSQVDEGITAMSVFAQLRPKMEAIELPAGVRLELGGELEESGKANAAILNKMPLGVLLLLFFLLLEFNSFRRVGIVLMTVPLAAVGVVPGLILSGNPLGFVSMLGIISLVGIVVNNAIVLLDVIESRRDAGSSVPEALEEAVRRRTRPILLTMATTVAGLTPLAFSEAALWPPLAWAMISGLMASTVLTLLVIPALYRVLFDRPSLDEMGFGGRRAAVVATLLITVFAGLFVAGNAEAVESGTSESWQKAPLHLTLDEAMRRAVKRPGSLAAAHRAEAASHRAEASRRDAWWPSVGGQAELVRRDRQFELETPLGSLVLGDRTSSSIALRIDQPLFDPAAALYGVEAARADARATAEEAERIRQELATEAAVRFVDILEIDASVITTRAFVESLEARLREMEARVKAGRVLESDALKIRLQLESAELDLLRLGDQRNVATSDLGRLVGSDQPVEPAYDLGTTVDRKDVEDFGAALETSLAARPDVQALQEQLIALQLQTREIRAARWPKLSAQLTYFSSDGDPFQPDELAIGGLAISWTPFARGTLAPRAAATEAEAEALRADLAEVRRAVEIQLRQSLARLSTARAALTVRERGVDLAQETLRVESERHSAGRATTNDLLDAEASLRDQATRYQLARLDVLKSWIAWDLASGALSFRDD